MTIKVHTSLILLASVATTVFTAPISTLENNGIYSQLERDNTNETLLITSAEELIEFSKSVNKGDDYSETTVYLDADIEFTEELSNAFEPIGNKKDRYKSFRGTFDGQGHTINNLKIAGSPEFAGLFGYSGGMRVRNLVMGSSCSYILSYEDSSVNRYVGGIIGFNNPNNDFAQAENCVNMAQIQVSAARGVNAGNIYIGGIAGSVSTMRKLYFMDCVNYGEIGYNGENSRFYVGGIAGYVSGQYSSEMWNCANFGALNEGESQSARAYVGGIIGYASSDEEQTFENCVSMGRIPSGADYKGAILGSGYGKNKFDIIHCIWTKKTSVYSPASYEVSANVDESTREVEVSEDIVEELNRYARKYTLNNWVYNRGKKPITFVVRNADDTNEGRVTIEEGMELVMLRNPVDGWFSGWFTDSAYNTHFTGTVVSWPNTVLYGKYCDTFIYFSVKYDVHVAPRGKGVIYGKTYGELPVPEKEGYRFIEWRSEDGEVITEDSIVTITESIDLYPVFEFNSYVLTFDFSNGTKVSYTLSYGDEIEYPIVHPREGYFFWKWNDTVTEMPGQNLTIKAVWALEETDVIKIIMNVLIIAVPAVVVVIVVIVIVVVVIKIRKQRRYAIVKEAEGGDDIKFEDEKKKREEDEEEEVGNVPEVKQEKAEGGEKEEEEEDSKVVVNDNETEIPLDDIDDK